MDNLNKMIASASGAISHIFNPSDSDKILILTDSYSKSVAKAFKYASLKIGCNVQAFEIDNNQRPLKEIPPELESLLPGKTIVLNIIKAFPEEIAFRIKWIFRVEENKLIKMGHMPGITEEMMLRSVNVDFSMMKRAADKLINQMREAVSLHITTEAGTDVMLGIKDRSFSGDIGVVPGEMSNLPCGEIYCAPLETEADGVVVFDASIGDIGLLESPLKVFIRKGRITNFLSDNENLVRKITQLTEVDEDAWIIGEFGIGVNPGAQITGNMLEDEKTLGTAHIAFGNNEDFPGGGKNKSKIHRDYLFYRPTIKSILSNGTEKTVILNGNII